MEKHKELQTQQIEIENEIIQPIWFLLLVAIPVNTFKINGKIAQLP